MRKNHEFVYRTIIVLLTFILIFTLVQSPRNTQAAPQTAGAQMLGVSVFDVLCTSLASVTTTYAKLTDLGTFTVNSTDSVVELTYNGRLYVNSFNSSIGAYFELRIDNLASSIGRARTNLRTAEVGGSGKTVSFTGYFSGLAAGDHTASIWVRTADGTASSAVVSPNCWGTDVLIVKEHLPFGVSYMPLINK